LSHETETEIVAKIFPTLVQLPVEFPPRTSADTSSHHSQQFQVLVKEPLVPTNDTSGALETFKS